MHQLSEEQYDFIFSHTIDEDKNIQKVVLTIPHQNFIDFLQHIDGNEIQVHSFCDLYNTHTSVVVGGEFKNQLYLENFDIYQHNLKSQENRSIEQYFSSADETHIDSQPQTENRDGVSLLFSDYREKPTLEQKTGRNYKQETDACITHLLKLISEKINANELVQSRDELK